MPQPTLYHYTCGHKLAGIEDAGKLKPSQVPAWAKHERPILWFSTNEQFEPSAVKALLDPATGAKVFDLDVLERKVGLYRFALAAGVLTVGMTQWPGCAVRAGMTEPHRVALAQAGLRMGAVPSQWWGTLATIDLEYLRMEVFDRNEAEAGRPFWLPITMAGALERFKAQGVAVASYSLHQQAFTGVQL